MIASLKDKSGTITGEAVVISILLLLLFIIIIIIIINDIYIVKMNIIIMDQIVSSYNRRDIVKIANAVLSVAYLTANRVQTLFGWHIRFCP